MKHLKEFGPAAENDHLLEAQKFLGKKILRADVRKVRSQIGPSILG
jgi:hypothetical protein